MIIRLGCTFKYGNVAQDESRSFVVEDLGEIFPTNTVLVAFIVQNFPLLQGH